MEKDRQGNYLTKEQIKNQKGTAMWKFFLYSGLGILIFFIPVTMFGGSSILLDHLVTAIQKVFGDNIKYYTLLIIIIGAVLPFINGTWRKTTFDLFFTLFKILGVAIGAMVVFNFGPGFVLAENIGPFLFNSLAINLSLLIPLGGAALGLLVGYGLLTLLGILMEPVMRPVFKTPGRTAIDAVASFVGSYSVGLLITNRIYKEGLYSRKEALIVATGFSTVSVTFMVVVARTLELMDHWLLYFWITLIVTFLVTAISVHLPPISTQKKKYYGGKDNTVHEGFEGNRFSYAWCKTKQESFEFEPLLKNIAVNFLDAMKMTTSIIPSILSIGFVGLVIAEYTDIIGYLSYMFYPFLFFWPLEDPGLIAEAAMISVVEMFLPALLVVEADIVTKFIVGVTSVSAIIFLSGLVPAILSTDLNIKLWKLLVVWFIRVALTLLIVTPVALLLF
ncbi:Nucleoside recognition [Jeotgalicoccus saudimassiliensis]|uniref:Nucleoside recognition n=1 Tax=Jeotgalicoccus saudimassiliensis TaxID=1461582 RepID=A0A078MC20_9STAP|nr:YjiH family protein [Jeotgalicoccus saudimassiliensis]CEA02236.1 Nucleoside recognition [Jeotgalicoccus saudimassiliensis]